MLISPRCNVDRPLPFRTPTSVKNLLHIFLKLEAKPQFDDLFHLARHASGNDAVKIKLLLEDKSGAMVEEFLDGCDWPGLFKRLPSLVSCPIEELLMLIPVQNPRYYSVSSAYKYVSGHLDLTVALHSFMVGGLAKFGVCSGYLHRLIVDDNVQIRVINVPHFRLPISNYAPVLAIANGAGIAPLRAFWQERDLRLQFARHHTRVAAQSGDLCDLSSVVKDGVLLPSMVNHRSHFGSFVLCCGARSSIETLYRDEIVEAMEKGVISEAHFALSREKGLEKTYVQHLFLDGDIAKSVKMILKHPNATIFVCGDANMAYEVEEALQNLIGEAEWGAIRSSNRYHEDVFGINTLTLKVKDTRSSSSLSRAMPHNLTAGGCMAEEDDLSSLAFFSVQTALSKNGNSKQQKKTGSNSNNDQHDEDEELRLVAKQAGI